MILSEIYIAIYRQCWNDCEAEIMEGSKKWKVQQLKAMELDEIRLAKKIDEMMTSGNTDLAGHEEQIHDSRCGTSCFPWMRRGRGRLARDDKMEIAVFGHGASSGSANNRLNLAAEQVEQHAHQLAERALASRQKAQSFLSLGKKQEALMALKRAKHLEKQAEVASATHATIENQKDMIQSSMLQREIASALSASIATTKKKTRGLLEKTESAVDDSAELRDEVDDISEAMGGLARVEEFDDDELMAELDAMSGEVSAVPSASATGTVAPVAAPTPTAAVSAAIDPSLYPMAPTKKGEDRKKLLAFDSAAAPH